MTPRAIFDFFMDASEGYDAIAFEITAAAVHDNALREILEEDTREDIILCEEFLEQLKGRGILKRSADTRVLAGAMIAMFLGLYGLIHFGISRDEAIRAWDGMFGEWMVEG